METILLTYCGIGVLVYVLSFYKIAYYFANSQKGYMSGHPVSSFNNRGLKPGMAEFIATLLWFPGMIAIWPIILMTKIEYIKQK